MRERRRRNSLYRCGHGTHRDVVFVTVYLRECDRSCVKIDAPRHHVRHSGPRCALGGGGTGHTPQLVWDCLGYRLSSA